MSLPFYLVIHKGLAFQKYSTKLSHPPKNLRGEIDLIPHMCFATKHEKKIIQSTSIAAAKLTKFTRFISAAIVDRQAVRYKMK